MADIAFLTVLETFIWNYAFKILLIIFLAWVTKRLGSLLFERLMRRLIRPTHFNGMSEEDVVKRRDTLVSMLGALWSVVVWVVAVITIIAQLGIETAPLLASAGILGIALGFGAQSLIKDFLSGIFIILENQYRVGDVVDLEGAAGTVEKITVRSTVVRDIDGNVHYLPNGTIMHVINKTMGFSKVNLSVAVAPDTDIEKLTEVINQVGEKLANEEKWREKIIDPPHFLNISNFTDTALEVTIIGKTQPSQQWSVSGELRRRLLAAFKKHGIVLAHVLPLSFGAAPKKSGR